LDYNCGFNGGSRIIRKSIDNDNGFNYNCHRTNDYPIEKSITWEQFKQLKSSKINMEKEITGYVLLKDMVGAKSGSIITKKDVDGDWLLNSSLSDLPYIFNQVEISQTDWFKPIYKPKPIELPLINGYKGKIIRDHGGFKNVVYGCNDQYKADINDLESLLGLMEKLNFSSVIHDSKYTITRNDITIMIKALKQDNY
jgi:hypothetical protein